MTKKTRISWFTVAALAATTGLVAAGTIWSGWYDIGADSAHTRPVYTLLQTLRDRSIDTRAARLQVPGNLADPARIRQGAGNYDAMCTGCHLTPGAAATELSRGLYPAPPNLSRQPVAAARAFWVIKHGIKASGMPAWGASMDDEYVWNIAAFLQQLPRLDATQYRALVASSGGHSHGGGETGGHAHAESDGEGAHDHEAHEHAAGSDDHHDEGPHHDDDGLPGHEPHADPAPAAGVSKPTPTGITHVHADGKRHVHASPAPAEAAAPATAPATDAPAEHDHHH